MFSAKESWDSLYYWFCHYSHRPHCEILNNMATRRINVSRRRAYRRRAPARRRVYRRPYRRSYRRASAPAVHPRKEMTGTGQGDKYIKAFVDPFMDSVDGVKIPDSNAQPSIALKCLDTIDLSTGATYGSNVCAFNASPASLFVGSGSFSGSTTWSWPATFSGSVNAAKLANIQNDQEMYRPVAHAVRITSALAPTAATGFLHVCVFSQALYNQSTWQYPTSVAAMQNVPGYKRVPLGRLTAEGLLVVNRPMDVTAQRYIDSDSPVFATAGTMEFQSGLQWCSILVAITGAPLSSTPISVENVLHIECIPRSTAISQSTPAAKYNVAALGGASNAASKATAAVLDSEKGKRAAEVIQAAAQGVNAAGGGGGGRKNTGSWMTKLLQGVTRGDMSYRPSYDGIRNSAPSHSGML